VTFPVVFHVFGLHIPAHGVMEVVAYAVGMQTFLYLRRRDPSPAVNFETTMWLIVCCVFGALAGSKILAWMELSPEQLRELGSPQALVGGKTIVGGLLGGWAGVEIGKRWLDVTVRTGDAYVIPLALGIAIGRVGCFLTGLPDHTYGVETQLPWGVDFGDGVRRHPTQLYEIAVVLLLGAIIALVRRRITHQPGDLFRWFMLGYLLFRLLVEFIKPVYRPSGLSAIQWACVAGMIACIYGLIIRPTASRRTQAEVSHAGT
jgi:prolipoprotein diacylglyceryltransferase